MTNHYPCTTHWHYLHDKPSGTGILKSLPEDFQVAEFLPFELTGEGEHLFLHIEKTGINTGFLAQQLAEFYHVRERDVSYAGRKDKHAITRQWFSVWLPGRAKKTTEQPSESLPRFTYPDCQVLDSQWHNKKLRTGAVQENQFVITLRDVEPGTDLEERIEKIKRCGVPNYFGPQRFGNLNADNVPGNLALADYLLKGETIRKREKRSMAISALRSWLFNEFTSLRLQKWQSAAKPGDAMNLVGSNSYFVADDIDDEVSRRLIEQDIAITAPMWGKGSLPSLHSVAELEKAISSEYHQLCRTLEGLDLKQERRKILLFPRDLQWHLEQGNLTLKFSLPAGCFATSVIRELLHIHS